jgi:GntR family transcriptional regulator, transcriptional repressor for pyruvate dehydrogenase complex
MGDTTRTTRFEAVRQAPNLTAELVDRLVRQIETGALAPGQKLPTEQSIVAATGVSRTVVREALASLRARGLITTRQGLGAFVRAEPGPAAFTIRPEDLASIADVLRLLELRVSVEVEAAGLAARRRTAEDLERMRGHLKTLDAAIEEAGSGAEADFAFHRAVLVATGNPYFARFFDVFGQSIIPRQRIRLEAMPAAERRTYLGRIQREHRRMLEAIEAGDAGMAQRASRAHLRKAYQRYALMRGEADDRGR